MNANRLREMIIEALDNWDWTDDGSFPPVDRSMSPRFGLPFVAIFTPSQNKEATAMNEIKTDTKNVTLTYGEHIGHDPAEHVSFGRNPLSGASWAIIDSPNRRVVYFPTNPVTDPRSGAGAKIKKVMSAYRKKYGESVFATVMVRNDVVTSVQNVSQKKTHLWDWHTHKQVEVKGGWKYKA